MSKSNSRHSNNSQPSVVLQISQSESNHHPSGSHSVGDYYLLEDEMDEDEMDEEINCTEAVYNSYPSLFKFAKGIVNLVAPPLMSTIDICLSKSSGEAIGYSIQAIGGWLVGFGGAAAVAWGTSADDFDMNAQYRLTIATAAWLSSLAGRSIATVIGVKCAKELKLSGCYLLGHTLLGSSYKDLPQSCQARRIAKITPLNTERKLSR